MGKNLKMQSAPKLAKVGGCRKLSPVTNFKFFNDFTKNGADFVVSKTLRVQHTHNSCKYLITGYLPNNTIQYIIGENFLKLNSYCVCVATVKSLKKLFTPLKSLKTLKSGCNLKKSAPKLTNLGYPAIIKPLKEHHDLTRNT